MMIDAIIVILGQCFIGLILQIFPGRPYNNAYWRLDVLSCDVKSLLESLDFCCFVANQLFKVISAYEDLYKVLSLEEQETAKP